MEILNKKERLERIEYRIYDLRVLANRENIDLGIDWDKAVNRLHRFIKSSDDDYRVEVSE